MALPSSGSLSILDAAGGGRSISFEVTGTLNPNTLAILSATAGKSSPHSMLEFYNYSSTPPDAPTNPSASVLTNDVTVTWDPPLAGEDPTQYRVERQAASNPGVWTFIVNEPFGSDDSITDNDLATDQYTYRIRSENSAGESSYVSTNSVLVI